MANHGSKKLMAIDISIELPLTLKVIQPGKIEVHCYQAIAGTQDPILMKLIFSQSASGALVGAVQSLLENKQISLSHSPESPLQ